MSDLVDEWELWQRAGGLSQRTIEERLSTVARCARSCDADPATFTDRQITRWLAGGDWKPSTRATWHGHLRAWHSWLCRMGHRADDPMVRVPCPRRPRGEPHPLADEHIARLVAVLNRKRTRAMVMLAALAGLRVHEIAKVRGEDFDARAGTLRVTGKGNVTAILPLHPELAELVAIMPSHGWWFPSHNGGHVHWRSVSDTIRHALRRAGVPGSAHSIRHWFGTSLVADGADLATAQRLLRHASLATTQVYVQVADHRKREAIGRLSLTRAA